MIFVRLLITPYGLFVLMSHGVSSQIAHDMSDMSHGESSQIAHDMSDMSHGESSQIVHAMSDM